MFYGPLPHVPCLTLCASVTRSGDRTVSATGLGETEAEARLRHDAERAERLCAEPGGLHGRAAGTDGSARVEERAGLELIERWVARRWWSGALPPFEPDPATAGAFSEAQARWPRLAPRRTKLVLLAKEDMPPVGVAWSAETGERGLCFGVACRRSGLEAARAALRELYQMEFGLDVARHRAAHGAPLTGTDRAVLERADGLGVAEIACLLEPRAVADTRDCLSVRAALDALAGPVTTDRVQIAGHTVVTVLAGDAPPLLKAQEYPLHVGA